MAANHLRTRAWRRTRARILARDQHTCWVCGGHADQVDHLIPRVQGGDHSDENLRAICEFCNKSRGGRQRVKGRRIRAARSRAW